MASSDGQGPIVATRDGDGQSPAPSSGADGTLAAGSRFGRYSIARLIGSGGMGSVYEAQHTDLKKRVAIKILHPTYAANEEIQTRFLREGEAASRIRHAHVVDMTDFGVTDGTPFLVMEYLEGESLAARIKREPLLTPTEVADVMVPVCAAVGAAHDEGVIHRDLKPENIFLSRSRQGEMVPKVVDFGVCKLNDQGVVNSLTATNSLIGSPAYMSPEQIRSNKNTTPSVDQYALGVIMYECLAGRKPFVAESLFEIMGLIVQGDCPPPSELRPELPKDLEAVVLRAMHKDSAARFESVHKLGAALVPFASPRTQALWASTFGLTPVARITPSPEPPAASPVPPVPAATRGASERDGASGTLAQSARAIDAVPVAPPARGTSRNLWIGLAVLGAALGVGGMLMAHRAQDGTPVAATRGATATAGDRFRAHVEVQPASARIELDGAAAGTGTFERTFTRDGQAHTLRFSADGYREQTVRFQDQAPPATVRLEAAPGGS
jgi:serine/threonine-protein kinase